MRSKAKSTAVTLGSHELAVSPVQLARCAGGTRYRMDAAQRKFIEAVLERAKRLVNPAFVYSIHEITAILEGGYVKLHNGLTFPLPPGEPDAGMKYLAFCVCTLGGRLEEAVRTSVPEGDALDGLFLDAAGVAFLEALGTRAYETLEKQARERVLQSGCRMGPGCGELDLSFQKQLFELVDASSVGVQLNESCMMNPAKSLSFVVRWTTSPMSGSSRNKCASCTLTNCPYRLE